MGRVSNELNNRIHYTPIGIVSDARGNLYETLKAALTYGLDRVFMLYTDVRENVTINNCSITTTNESAIIGNTFIGDNVTIKGVEFYWDAWASRRSALTGSDPADIPTNDLTVQGDNVTLMNCYIHDLSTFFVATGSLNFAIRGCIFGRCGWDATDRGHGHGIYMQPIGDNMRVANCICIENYAYGIKIYKESAAVSGIIVEDCISFGSGLSAINDFCDILYGGYHVNGAVSFLRNICLSPVGVSINFWSPLGPASPAAIDVTIENNLFRKIIYGSYVAISDIGNNTNTLGNGVRLVANEDDSERWTLVIRNEALANAVSVDVSGILNAGDFYELINSQDYLVDRVFGIVPENQIIVVDMQAMSHSVSAPIGAVEDTPTKCFPQFGAFILRKQ